MQYARLFTALSFVAVLVLTGCGDPDGTTEVEEAPDIVEDTTPTNTITTVAEDAGLTTFRTAVAQAGLDETLDGPGPYTVFAPSDEAFSALPEGILDRLLEPGSRDELQRILTYHVLPRSVMSGDLSGDMSVASVQGQNLMVRAADGSVVITDGMGNTANVISADNAAGNGVIHVIDAVLMPGEDGGVDTLGTDG